MTTGPFTERQLRLLALLAAVTIEGLAPIEASHLYRLAAATVGTAADCWDANEADFYRDYSVLEVTGAHLEVAGFVNRPVLETGELPNGDLSVILTRFEITDIGWSAAPPHLVGLIRKTVFGHEDDVENTPSRGRLDAEEEDTDPLEANPCVEVADQYRVGR